MPIDFENLAWQWDEETDSPVRIAYRNQVDSNYEVIEVPETPTHEFWNRARYDGENRKSSTHNAFQKL